MIHNLKALGLALFAVLALGALAASSASAVDTFTSTGASETVSGTSTNGVFKITNGAGEALVSVECTTATFDGTVTKGTAHANFTATYTGTLNTTPHSTHCSSSLGEMQVTMEGCTYDVTGTTTGTDAGGTDATVSLTCPVGKVVVIHFPEFGITFTIHEQTPTSGGFTYTNTTLPPNNKKVIDVKATVTGTTYTCEPAFLCELGGVPAEGNNADYTGDVTVSSVNNIEWSTS
jgi:hypothetical protein